MKRQMAGSDPAPSNGREVHRFNKPKPRSASTGRVTIHAASAMLMILALFAAPAFAQSIPQCTTVPATPTLAAGDKVGMAFCSNEPTISGAVVIMDGVRQPIVAPVKVAAAGADGYAYYETPKTAVLAAGAHVLRVYVTTPGGDSGPSDPVSVTVSGGVVDDPCGILGADRVSAVVTRAGFQAGTQSGVLYQLSSKSPVTDVAILLNGVVVSKLGAHAPGDTLTRNGGVWFDTPKPGVYKVEVQATNAAGCTARAVGLVDLTIQ